MGAWEWEQGHLEAVSQLKISLTVGTLQLGSFISSRSLFCSVLFCFLLNIMQTEEQKQGRPGNEAKFWVPIKNIRVEG